MKENIDKLFKDALQNRDFDFDEQDWKAFQAMQQAPEKKRRVLAWWRVPIAATLLLGIGMMAYYSNRNTVIKDENWSEQTNTTTDFKNNKESEVAVLDKNSTSPSSAQETSSVIASDKIVNAVETKTNDVVTKGKSTTVTSTVTTTKIEETVALDKSTKGNQTVTTEKSVKTTLWDKNTTNNTSIMNENVVETASPAPTNATTNNVKVEEVTTTPNNDFVPTSGNSLVPTTTPVLSETIATILNDNNKATNKDLLAPKTTPKRHWTWEGISIAAGFAPEQYEKTGQSIIPTTTPPVVSTPNGNTNSQYIHTVSSSTIYAAIGTNVARPISTAWRFITGVRYSYRGGRVYNLSELQLAAETQNALFSDPQSKASGFTISRYRKLHSLEIPLYFDYALTSVWGIQLGVNNAFTLAASQDKYEPFNTNSFAKDFAYGTLSSFEPLPYRRYVPALLLGTDWRWKNKNSFGAEITYSTTSNYQNHTQFKVLASPTVKRFLGRLVYTRKF
jgi:hypothetical protein